MRSLITILFTILSFSVAAKNDETYDSLQLEIMPTRVQKYFIETLSPFGMVPVFLGENGSQLLKLNLLFSDHFLGTKIAIKYKTDGNYELNKFYKAANGFVYHTQIDNTDVAIYFENFADNKRREIIKTLRQRRDKISSYSFSIISSAHAEHVACDYHNQKYQSFNSDIVNNSKGASLSSCLTGLISGAKDSSVGLVTGIAKGVASEAKKLWKAPGKRLSQYWGFVGKKTKQLWKLSKILGQTFINPLKGLVKLKKKYGEFGTFLANTYTQTKALPKNQKLELFCDLLGSIGVDAILIAITAGAAGAKLATTITSIFNKLKKVVAIISKGIILPFKVLKTLPDETIKRLKSFTKNDTDKDFINKKLEGVNCAI